MSTLLHKINKTVSGRPLLIIFLLFLLVQAVLYYQYGVFTGLEAQKYVDEGSALYNTGKLTEPKYIFYLPVILLVYFCKLTGLPLGFVVLVQVLLSALALFYFYRLGRRLGNATVAFYSSLLLSLFLPLQSWNFFLYSDSIFISLTLIYTYIIFTHGNSGWKGTLLIILFLLLLIFSRPHGLLFIPPTIIYLLFKKQTKAVLLSNALLCILLLGGMYYLLNAAFTGGGDMDAMKPFVEEHIICFVPLKPQGAILDIIHTANPVNDLFYYIIHNPLHFLRMSGLKLLSFFNLTRSYYSASHNISLLVFFLPVYLFSLAGLYRLFKPATHFTIFLLSLLILYPLGATFQCDDWHSRFTLVVFPYFILLACLGAYFIFGKKLPKTA